MRIAKLVLVVIAVTAACKKAEQDQPAARPPPGPGLESNDGKLIDDAKQFAKDLEPKLRKLDVDQALADWANQTDITKEHEAASAKASEIQSVEVTKLVKTARKFDPILGKLDPDTRRQLMLLKFQAQPAPDDPKQAKELAEITTEMGSLYGKGVCATENGKESCKDVEYWSKQLQNAKTPDAMLTAWKAWHDYVGHAEKDKFVRFVELANAGAKGIGFSNISELWQGNYDMKPAEFVAMVDKLWDQVKPLYVQMHCYARRVLNKQYGDKVVPPAGLIPAHVTGNMWAQDWGYLYPQLEPYKGVAAIDVTPVLAKSYDPQKMVRMGEAFYTSLGMIRYRRRSGSGRCSRIRRARTSCAMRARGTCSSTTTCASRCASTSTRKIYGSSTTSWVTTTTTSTTTSCRSSISPARTTASTRRSATRCSCR